MKITRELDKESLLNYYPIYTITCGSYYDYASTMYTYPKVHVSSMSAPCIHHEVAMWLTYFLMLSSRLFPTFLAHRLF